MGLQVPHVLGQQQRFAALFESTPGTYNPPAATDFIKVLETEFAYTQNQEPRDDANEGLDPYEMITARGDIAATITRYYTPAAAGTAPPEAPFLRALFQGAPVVGGSSASYPLLNTDAATTARTLTVQRYHNADDVFVSQAIRGFVVNEGKFSWSGNDKPKMMFSGKGQGFIQAGYGTTSGTGTSATITMTAGEGNYFTADARINVGSDTNLTVSSVSANSVVLSGSITFGNGEVVTAYCPTPNGTAGAVLGYTEGALTYNGTSTRVTSWEFTVNRNMEWEEDTYGSSFMTDAFRGRRAITGKFGVNASRTLVNDLIRRANTFAEVALVIRVGSASGRRVTHTFAQIVPMIDPLKVPATGKGTIEVPFIAIASTEGAVDALTTVYE